jgi:hypothetical protein
MAIQEIEVPDGKTVFPYFVDDENVDLAIECFADPQPITYVLDDDGKPTNEEANTAADRARVTITAILDRRIQIHQEKKLIVEARASGTIKSNVVQ